MSSKSFIRLRSRGLGGSISGDISGLNPLPDEGVEKGLVRLLPLGPELEIGGGSKRSYFKTRLGGRRNKKTNKINKTNASDKMALTNKRGSRTQS